MNLLPRYEKLLKLASDEKSIELKLKSPEDSLEAREANVRKQWLIFFYINLGFDFFALMFIGSFAFLSIAKTFLSLGIDYYCGYKHKGTIWLGIITYLCFVGTVFMSLSFIYINYTFSSEILSMNWSNVLNSLTKEMIGLSVLAFVQYVLNWIYLWHCYRLWKINKELKLSHKLESSLSQASL